MLYTYKRTNKKWCGHTVYKCFFDGQLIGYRIKVPAYSLVWTKNGWKQKRVGYQYKNIDRVKWTPDGKKEYMTLEEQWATFA